jgi:uncharacterized protein (DUF2235 family)
MERGRVMIRTNPLRTLQGYRAVLMILTSDIHLTLSKFYTTKLGLAPALLQSITYMKRLLRKVSYYRLLSVKSPHLFFPTAISREIGEAYSFICDNYRSEDDEIILIGFSRGAFTVRAVASLINDIGILKEAGRYTFQSIYNLWEKQISVVEPSDPSVKGQELNDRMSKLYERSPELEEICGGLAHNNLLWDSPPIRACAVWDTVASLGFQLPGYLPQIRRRPLAFVNSRLCPNIKNAFQALALDENRFHFQPRLWVEHADVQTLKQCWFLGSHGDVGGGNQISGLTNLSLTWMISQLGPYVSFNENKIRHLASNWTHLAKILRDQKLSEPAQHTFEAQNSMTWGFWLAGSKIREPGKYVQYPKDENSMTADSEETIHFSVRVLSDDGRFERDQFLKDYKLDLNVPYSWSSTQHPLMPPIPEAASNKFELDILEEWLKDEKDLYGDEAGSRLVSALPAMREGLTDPVT